MSDQIITGEIHFFRAPLPVELEELTAFLSRCAAENRIWINTGERIRNPDARYKCSVNDNGDEKYLAEKYLPFEITDSQETDGCDRILSGIWYSDSRIADFGTSGIHDIENFLADIMNNELIQYVQLSFDPAHGYIPQEHSYLDITAKEFCKALTRLPCHSAVPDVQLNIRRDKVNFLTFKEE